ncbi:hypothetical protein ASD34_01840 [Variovorax sp. Root473]|nr:hypothetical protein ASD34_01840 [Variovorax sp. Root473]
MLSMLSWAASILVLNVLLTGLERRQALTLTGPFVALIAGALLLWAVLIYWWQVPATPSIARRVTYFIAYVAVMALLGLIGVWAAFWATVAIHGL